MAQTNSITAALRDVVTEFVHNESISPEEGQKRLAEAAAAAAEAGRCRPCRDPASRERRALQARPASGTAVEQIAKLVAVVTLGTGLLYVVGFTLWTVIISFTDSTLLPEYTFVGLKHYERLLNTRVWQVAYANLLVYGVCFMLLATAIGLLLAILIDQKIRAETLLRTIYLYPMALSFVVTGTVWAWLLNPSIGIQKFVRGLGFSSFRFDWLVDRDMAIYTVVIAAVWQASGFAMALFLAGLRSLDADLYKAAQVDGASPTRMYLRIMVPAIWPIVVAVLVILLQFAIKTYELVRALTAGGPGIATHLPTIVVYDYMFQRGLMGAGSAAAVMLLLSLLVSSCLTPCTAACAAAEPPWLTPSCCRGRAATDSSIRCSSRSRRSSCSRWSWWRSTRCAASRRSRRAPCSAFRASFLAQLGRGLERLLHGRPVRGIKPYMWNSLPIAVPATVVSTLIGAINGYVLSLWRFRGAALLSRSSPSASSCPRR